MALALLAGVVSFASPCVLPLVPGFLGYVTGLTDERRRTRLVTGAFLFVVGFSVVLVGVAAAYSWATSLKFGHEDLMLRLGGVVVILLALVYLGFIGQRGIPVRWRPSAGLLGAPLLGAVFGLSASPCVGPVYGAILNLANPIGDQHSTVHRGVMLAAFYCLGLGVPFLLIAAGWSRAEKASRWLRNHHRPIQLIGGTLMLVVGVLMVAGVWEHVITWLQARSSSFTPVI
ncbi:cytochrome c biogenesis CcdA family protein [Rudaeicoccus suwonensis]|uniref:Cytochrome c-type biogenesis protein n=1 Tax=Rudaeicoccus suwonensis TaxID=657409 RepID=A0A561DU50_9MICO|nr:cytochrome c biogenesis protein CcdA [Rudaeicoccus suwonensis]TWE06894.1 cytochrome c-type biogenesis protein [Rudaeicoccus suwonensis]